MKMVKSLLLGSAAGLIAVAGAQAADLPVKAKAVEYVKICSLYGVGYYYIPGTDTCIKIGGYVRFEAYHNYPQQASGYSERTSNIGYFTRHSNTFATQARFRMTGDVRTQTEYGTLRAYFAFGINAANASYENSPTALTTAMERAFIQFAGFTIGRADTFFAFYNGAAYGLIPMFLDGSSGPAGHNVFAYTWQFGNGLSASLSIEDANGSRVKPIIDLSATSLYGASDGAGQKVPDVVGNLRVDQAWGSAQIMGALSQVQSRYFTANPALPGCAANTTTCGHNGDEWGWAVGAGLTLKMPWDAKDTLSGVIAYSEGALGFVAYGGASAFLHKQDVASGALTNAVFANPGTVAGYGGGLELTEAWGGTIAFEHYWTPSLRTSWVAGYMDVSYNDTAKALIAAGGCQGATRAGTGQVFTAVSSCNPDFSLWRLASRTMWNPVANLDVGVEVAYTKVNTAWAGTANVVSANGLAAGTYLVDDQSVWTAAVRVQRSFWP
jgi:hypothetical protein